tara:strand:+ start:260 stop:454 length:195 start_codon:yes stop_codon:yes gene_type:complete
LEIIIKILKRDKAILNSLDMKEEKMIILFNWILEFRFSTPRILAKVLELKITSTPRFFQDCLNR